MCCMHIHSKLPFHIKKYLTNMAKVYASVIQVTNEGELLVLLSLFNWVVLNCGQAGQWLINKHSLSGGWAVWAHYVSSKKQRALFWYLLNIFEGNLSEDLFRQGIRQGLTAFKCNSNLQYLSYLRLDSYTIKLDSIVLLQLAGHHPN